MAEWYAEYLQSDHWQQTRQAALARAGYQCERCGEFARFSQHGKVLKLNVHHVTYERVGNENDDDLVVLCRVCHEREHKIYDTSYDKMRRDATLMMIAGRFIDDYISEWEEVAEAAWF